MTFAQFSFTDNYRFCCCLCSRMESQIMSTQRGSSLWHPTLPHGWKAVQNYLICPSHGVKLSVYVDGQPKELEL